MIKASESKHEVSLALATMIADKGTFAFKMVEDASFRAGCRRIVRLFAPGQEVQFPSRRTVRRDLIKIVADADGRERAAFLYSGRQLYSFTNDSTTSRAMVSYTCLTAHGMDVSRPAKWVLREWYLDCSPNDSTVSHTAALGYAQFVAKIRDFMGISADEFRLGDVTLLTVHDCGSNTPAQFVRAEQIDSPPCKGHRLNTALAHMDKCEPYQRALEPVNACSETIRKSAMNTHLLLAAQAAANVKFPKRFITGAHTRWTYDARAGRRSDQLLPYCKQLDISTMYFQNAGKKRDWKANLKKWETEAQFVLAFVRPLWYRVEFWTVFFEQSRRVTASFSRYYYDDLVAFCKALQDKLAEQRDSIPDEQYEDIDHILREFSVQCDTVFAPHHHDLLQETTELLDFRVAAPNPFRKARRVPIPDAHAHASRSWTIGKLMHFYDVHRVATALFKQPPPSGWCCCPRCAWSCGSPGW